MAETAETVNIERAAEYIRRGLLVVYPTETFFALGCHALNADAVGRVFTVKKRVSAHPLPVIAASIEEACRLADGVDRVSLALMEHFWPGSLTIILPAAGCVPEALTGGTGSVAVRVSPHETARRLLVASGGPLVSSSANISGRAPVIMAEQLDKELLEGVAGIVHGGEAPAGGLASTIVEVRKGKLAIRREGPVTKKQLERAGFLIA